MMSVSRVNVGPLPDNFLMLWSEPFQRSFVVSSFSLGRLAGIQRLTSAIHDFNVLVAEAGTVAVAVKVQLCVVGEAVQSYSVLGC